MEALQFDPQKLAISKITKDIPVIEKPDDVIVKVANAGVCGTDLHIIEGDFPCAKQPFTQGHEISGTIHSFGAEVKHLNKGDRVGVDPNTACGLCRFCHTALYHLCPYGGLNTYTGIFSNGGWAQYCKVSSKQIFKLPPSINLKQAVLVEPMSCIYHAFSRILPLHCSNNVLILGAGIIGNLCCSILHHTGHRKVYVSEPEAGRRELVKKLDTGFTIVRPNELDSLLKSDSIHGVDVCIDCSGKGKAIEHSLKFLNRGGKLCIFGCASPEDRVSVSPFEVFLRELTIYGAALNAYSYKHSIGLMEAMGSRYIDYNRLGVKVFSLNQYDEALKELKKGTISKAVFNIDPSAE